MNCINCGASINDERKTCPYCGKAVQIVPIYSEFDDDNISILMEAGKSKQPKSAPQPSNPSGKKSLSPEAQERIRARKEREKQKALEKKKKTQLALIIVGVICLCILLAVGIFFINDAINRSNNNSVDYQIEQAELALKEGDIKEAEGYYLRALELDKNDVDIYMALADIYKKQNKTDKMLEMYHEVIKIDKEHYNAYKALFQHYKSENNVDAIINLRKGVSNNRILALFQDYNVESPKIYLEGGNYKGEQEVMVSSKLNYEIYYTIDGSDPTTNGILYKDTIKLDKSGMIILKVVAKNPTGIYSDIVKETYYLTFDPPADPLVRPDGGVFASETYITIYVPGGCTAFYSWDNIDPTFESLTKFEYTKPIIIPSGTNVLSVIIYDNKTELESGVYRKQFTCTVPGIEVPIIIPPEPTEEDTEGTEGTEGTEEIEGTEGIEGTEPLS